MQTLRMFVELSLGIWDEILCKLIEAFETIKTIFLLSLDFWIRNSNRLHPQVYKILEGFYVSKHSL